VILAVVVLLILLDLSLVNNEQGNPSPENISEITGISQANASQTKYENDQQGFTLIIPKDWEVTATDSQFDFVSKDSADTITINLFEDSELSKIGVLTPAACDNFGSEFNKSITQEPGSEDFKFSLFKLNGTAGCQAQGAIKKDLAQKIYIMLKPNSQKLFTIYYLATTPASASTLEESINSFRFK